MAKKKKNKAKDPEKTAKKGERKEAKKDKKALREQGEDDIEKILAELDAQEAEHFEVTETVLDAWPSPRVSFAMILHPSNPSELVMFGGEYYNGDKTYCYQDLFRFNIDKREWKVIKSPNTPKPRSAHQLVGIPGTNQKSGHVFLFGGEYTSVSQSQFYHYRDFWKLDLADNTWEKIEVSGGPTGRSGHRMVACKRKIVVFGGFYDDLRTCEYYNDTYLFDLETGKWAKHVLPANAPCPDPRSGHQMVAFQDQVFVYGGYSKVKPPKSDKPRSKMTPKELEALHFAERGREHCDLWSLDLNTMRWTQCKMPGFKPSARAGFAMAPQPTKRRCVFFGGVHDDDNDTDMVSSLFLNDMYELGLENKRWKHLMLRKKRTKRRKEIAHSGKEDHDHDDNNNDNAQAEEQDEEHEPRDDEDAPNDDDDAPTNNNNNNNNNQNDDEDSEAPTPQLPPQQPEEGEVWPHPRSNCQMAISGNKLILYGGMVEVNKHEVTLNDMWQIDISKMSAWECLFAGDQQQWLGESSEEGEEGEEDDDDDDDDEEDSENSPDEANSDGDEEQQPAAAAAPVKATKAKQLSRQERLNKILENDAVNPRPNETLKDFFARTGDHWAKTAYEITEKTGKALRKDGFELAQKRFDEMRPELEALEEELRIEEETQRREADEKKRALKEAHAKSRR